MAEIKLKPCPFCGRKAELKQFYPALGLRVRTIVKCRVCRCNSGTWGRKDKAIEAWNRRAE